MKTYISLYFFVVFMLHVIKEFGSIFGLYIAKYVKINEIAVSKKWTNHGQWVDFVWTFILFLNFNFEILFLSRFCFWTFPRSFGLLVA